MGPPTDHHLSLGMEATLLILFFTHRIKQSYEIYIALNSHSHNEGDQVWVQEQSFLFFFYLQEVPRNVKVGTSISSHIHKFISLNFSVYLLH